jgi:hypothetical protein
MKKDRGELDEDDQSSIDEEVDYDDGEIDEEQQSKLPGLDDPRMWQVRVKKNHERTAVISLMNKSLYY